MADIVFPGGDSGSLNQDAMPSSQDLFIYKGDYVELFVTISDATNTPIVLDGSTPKAQLKLNYDDNAPINFSCSLTGVTGQVRIYLSSALASILTPGSYIWDFQVKFPSGDVRTYLAGDVTVYDEVTK
jgi:hypothetical protein